MSKLQVYNQTDYDVSDYLRAIGVTFSVTYYGERNEDGWEHDSFKFEFFRAGKKIGGPYSTGLGHREEGDVGNLIATQAEKAGTARPKRLSVGGYGQEWVKTWLVFPCPASILCSLLRDAEFGELLFPDFCIEFGGDQDSIRTTEIYKTCQETAMKLRLFSPGEREKLKEMLEEY
jgi:hypothetical protein